jgi:hypothetical protein
MYISIHLLILVADDLVNFDPNSLANGEGYYGSLNRMDTVALPAAMIKSQSYSSPSTNRYPAPAAYNEWEPGRITTATTFDNFTGSFLQHCHILPHEDTGQAVIVKIIDNMERSWLSFKKEFAPGENITIYKAATYQPFTLTANPKVSQRIAFGDINKDGLCDASDLADCSNNQTVIGYIPSDINYDGIVDNSDLSIVDNNVANIIQISEINQRQNSFCRRLSAHETNPTKLSGPNDVGKTHMIGALYVSILIYFIC